ncbi:MAG TPA: sigma-54 dependent transcriptional regulator [Polyangiaceae bacterium]|nr:sigma-54 dependent transcriptional regulator [Polyangiaceae bacterium]
MSETLKMLIVDEDQNALGSLSRDLSALGWEVRVASEPVRALQLAEKERADAIVTELRAGAAGHTLVEGLRRRSAESCILVVSSALDVGTAVDVIRAGADDVAEKPLRPSFIDARLREIMARRRSSATCAAREDAASAVMGETPSIRAVREQIRTVARFKDLPVMITGETGTGKELVAKAIHELSEGPGPFVPINCSAIPEALLESELFGHEAGSFTGARGAHTGLFEAAGTGTLMLDELGEMPASLQPKLLRAIESRSFRRIGGSRDIPLRARIVSATHRRIIGKDSMLRSDLYYRLAGFTIATPALRQRVEDIDLLARHFLSRFCAHYRVELTISARALEALHTYHWPGNVRELRAVVEQAAVLARDGRVGVAEIVAGLRDRQELAPEDEPEPGASGTLRKVVPGEPLRELERRTIKETWDSSGRNMSAAARALGLPRTTLRDRIRKYGWR